MKTTFTTFGELLAHLRKRAGMAQADLAAAVGYSRSLISALEQNRRQPEMTIVIDRLIPALGLHAEPQLAKRLVEMAAIMRNERPPVLTDFTQQTSPSSKPIDIGSPLPIPPTPLIGRDQDVIRIVNRFTGHSGRLMTLVGPPGVGKSRLALEIAKRLQLLFPDGTCFVSLAAVTEPAQLAPTLVQALDIVDTSNRLPGAQLIRFLRHKQALLVLDNFEQIITAASLIAELLTECSGLHCLVTSRERLHLRAEQRFRVLPLELASAVELFVQHAEAVQPEFVLTLQNQLVIAKLCQQLDCLPLAIELVAAHADLFTPGALLQQLQQQRLDLLTEGARDLPARQRTLRNAIHSSYVLLSDAEQRCFQALGIFVGSFSVEAVEALGFRDTVLYALMNKNLVSATTQHSEVVRFFLLETILQFCWEKLERLPEFAAIRYAYCTYFVGLVESAARRLHQADNLYWIERLTIEQDNLRAVLRYLLVDQQTVMALRLGCALWPFWEIRGLISEGRQWLTALLQMPNSADYPEQLAWLQLGAGILAEQHSEYIQAIQHLTAAITLAQEINDERLIATAHNQLGQAFRSQGNYEQSRQHHEQAVQSARTIGDKILLADTLQLLGKIHSFLGDDPKALSLLNEAFALTQNLDDSELLCSILIFLGTLANHQGDILAAHQYLNECLERANAIGNQMMIAYTLAELGILFVHQDHRIALQNIHESLKLFVEIEHDWGIARALEYCAIVANAAHQWMQACTIVGAADVVRTLSSTAPDPYTATQLDKVLKSATYHTSEQAMSLAWNTGKKMSLKEAIAYVLEVKVD